MQGSAEAKQKESKEAHNRGLILHLDLNQDDVIPLSAEDLKGVDDIAVGDAHGNFLGMIQKMRKLGMIHMEAREYTLLREQVDIHNALMSARRGADEAELKSVVATIKTQLTKITPGKNANKRMVWLGDVLADRGPNDYFSLLLLKQVKDVGVNSNITFSNHDLVFFQNWRRSYHTGMSSTASYHNLHALMLAGVVESTDVDDLLRDAYFPQLNLINYTLRPDGKMVLYPHSSVPSIFYREIAAELGVKFSVASVAAFAESIDRINEAVRKRGGLDGRLDKSTRLARLIDAFVWNDPGDTKGERGRGSLMLTPERAIFPDYLDKNIISVHGHVGQKSGNFIGKGHGEFHNEDCNFARRDVYNNLRSNRIESSKEYYKQQPGERFIQNQDGTCVVEATQGRVPVYTSSSVTLEKFQEIDVAKMAEALQNLSPGSFFATKEEINAKISVSELELLAKQLRSTKNLVAGIGEKQDVKMVEAYICYLLDACEENIDQLAQEASVRYALGFGGVVDGAASITAGYYIGNGTLFSSTALTSVNTLTGTQAISQAAIGAAVGGLVFASGAALLGAAYFAYKGEYKKSAGCAGLAVAFGVTAVLAPYVGLGILALVGLAVLVKKAYDAYQGSKRADGYERVSDTPADKASHAVAARP